MFQAGKRREPPLATYLADTREDVLLRSLRSFLSLAGAAVILGWWYLSVQPRDTATLYALIALSTAACSSLWLKQRSPRLAAALLLTACFVLFLYLLASKQSPSLVGPLALTAVMAGAFYTPPAALAVGVLASAAAAGVAGHSLPALALALPASTGIVTWLALRPLHEILYVSCQQCARATMLSEELRDQRGHLNRTIKDLDASYQLLQQTNHDLVLARREAEELRQLRHSFATNLSHELRTPLNIILGFANLICMRPELYGYSAWRDTLLKDLAEIRRSAAYLSELVSDVVDLARADALSMPLQRRPTDLRVLIEESVALARGLAKDKKLSIVAQCESLPELVVDPMRIEQVLFNLLSNAVRFTDRGSVTVSAQATQTEVVISVIDTGRGVSSEELVSIFDEYYQVGRPRRDPDTGKGLGLAIAKRLVQLHGGRIWAESVEGQGSAFHFSLPLHESADTRSAPPAATAQVRSRLKAHVAVLDEDGTAVPYLRRRLDTHDFVPARDREHLALMVAAESPVAVIAGNDLPASVCEELRQQLPPDGLLIQCDLPNSSWVTGPNQFSGVLSKPVTVEALMEAYARCVPHRGEATVLVVDDDRGFVRLVTRLLQSELGDRCRVVGAYRGEAALAKARRFRPDMVLLDLLLPDMSGFDVLAEFRKDPDLAAIPIVAATAATPGEDRVKTEGASFTVTRRGAFEPGDVVGLIEAALIRTLSRARRSTLSEPTANPLATAVS